MSRKLVDEFRSKLDEALILAIASEYNLADASSFEDAHSVLKTLADDAEAEEATGFNPDGLGAQMGDLAIHDEDQKGSDETPPTQQSETHQSETQPSQLSSITSPWEDDYEDIPRIESFDHATNAAKVSQLRSMFLTFKDDQIKEVLKGANGDFQSALEELLTLQYLESTETEPEPEPEAPRNATDDFFKPDEEPRRKRKGKKRRGKINESPPSEEEKFNPHRVDEVIFISDRLNVTFDEVAGPYYESGCSQGKAIVVVLDSFVAQGVGVQDPAGQNRVEELGMRYKRVPVEYLSAIVQLVSIPQFADDIAKVLDGHFSKPAKEHLAVNYTLAPPEHLVTDGFTVVSSRKGGGKPLLAACSPGAGPSFSTHGATWADATKRAALYEKARSAAATSASQAARKGRSNPLFKQAAGVYADMAKENGRKAQWANSRAADVLVAERRTENLIDLHGVSVKDGVRIAQAEVQAWYNGLGEFKAKEAKKGFTVVTGLGRHSKSGVSMLRQAVCAGLVNDGWKVEVGTGRFTVKGRR